MWTSDQLVFVAEQGKNKMNMGSILALNAFQLAP